VRAAYHAFSITEKKTAVARNIASPYYPTPLNRAVLCLAMRKLKLLQRLKNNPQSATFDDVRRLLLGEGFNLDRVSGSLHIFKRGAVIFVIPVHANRVKSIYIRRLIELIESKD
jgi:predicted RNA binding protein YcfA (HicA-like mRNA interferase family)